MDRASGRPADFPEVHKIGMAPRCFGRQRYYKHRSALCPYQRFQSNLGTLDGADEYDTHDHTIKLNMKKRGCRAGRS